MMPIKLFSVSPGFPMSACGSFSYSTCHHSTAPGSKTSGGLVIVIAGLPTTEITCFRKTSNCRRLPTTQCDMSRNVCIFLCAVRHLPVVWQPLGREAIANSTELPFKKLICCFKQSKYAHKYVVGENKDAQPLHQRKFIYTFFPS